MKDITSVIKNCSFHDFPVQNLKIDFVSNSINLEILFLHDNFGEEYVYIIIDFEGIQGLNFPYKLEIIEDELDVIALTRTNLEENVKVEINLNCGFGKPIWSMSFTCCTIKYYLLK